MFGFILIDFFAMALSEWDSGSFLFASSFKTQNIRNGSLKIQWDSIRAIKASLKWRKGRKDERKNFGPIGGCEIRAA